MVKCIFIHGVWDGAATRAESYRRQVLELDRTIG
jgi:hypothetical protein